ncbi:FecR domain-containing protein [Sulfurimonas sp.]|uniref:FecR family protein n=1 Tax=Sulfurimonas sp. TaxID=2022749 RepID=UPI0035641345
MKLLTKIVLLFFLLSVAIFAKDVATVTALNGSAFVERDGTKVEITIGASLQEKDTILTDDKAKVQIIFTDETIVTVGKNSNFSIKEYLFEDSQEPVAKFAMLKGAMRTITGKIGKIAPDKFSVHAKTALIGIRGTNFSVLVGEDDSVNVYCTFGAISVTVSGSEYVVNQGFYITISPDGRVEIKEFTPQDLKDMKEKNFGKSASKKGYATEDATATNEGQLDTTTEEMDNVFIKDITDTSADSIQTLSTGVESYTRNGVLYTGTFSQTATTGSTPILGPNGSAELTVNFGLDTAELTLNSTATFNQNPSFTGNDFTLGQTINTGNATGTFQGTGSSVNGTYYNDEGAGTTSSGTYNVTTTDALY